MSEPWPLFDLFLDLPHPVASPSCYPPFVIRSPDAAKSEQVQKELGEAASLARIARFAFPEHDDQVPPPPTPHEGSAKLNRFDVYVTQGFQQHTFSLQLSTGQRVHGHVRRYLPSHLEAPSRYDVGRRGVRALVLLTRASGGDLMYSAMLKTVEAISAMQAATPKELHTSPKPQEHFLQTCLIHHAHLCTVYSKKPHDERKPMMLTIEGLEFGSAKLKGIDTTRFLVPTTLLQPPNTLSPTSSMTESPMLPLLRCLGVPNTLRLLSALLCERRVLLISKSPTRLAACARSALSMLAQGMLHWQHLFIPVLTPMLIQYLAAPMPYLIGILSPLMPKLDQVQELGEVLLIYLDSNSLETRGIPTNEIANRIPDLFRSTVLEPQAPTEPSAAETLANQLVELLKQDKKIMSGDSALQNVGETAAKATQAVKSAFGKLKKKGKMYLQQASSASDYDVPEPKTPPPELANNVATTPDDVYAAICQNPVGEEEARISFAAFFLCLYGDMRWYLGASQGQVPQFDRKKFLHSKMALGDVQGTPMFALLQNMCHSQMFEQFVKERVEEVRTRVPITKESPLFVESAHYIQTRNAEFSVNNVRNVTRQIAQSHPARPISQANANARRLAMSLTSNKTFEGNHGQAVAQLVELSHETSSVLFDVMSVLWMRIRDSKGMQWKHGLYALQIMRNLLFHGPLAAISEATDGLDKIRAMKTYHDAIRAQPSRQIQEAARDIYTLLVDRAKLFSIRRYCVDRRRVMRSPPKGHLPKDTRLRVTSPFKSIHAALHPNARRQVAPAPGSATRTPPRGPAPVPRSPAPAPVQDLLGFSGPPQTSGPSAPPPSAEADLLAAFSTQAAITAPKPTDPFASAAPAQAAVSASPQVPPNQAPALQQNPFGSPPGQVQQQQQQRAAPQVPSNQAPPHQQNPFGAGQLQQQRVPLNQQPQVPQRQHPDPFSPQQQQPAMMASRPAPAPMQQPGVPPGQAASPGMVPPAARPPPQGMPQQPQYNGVPPPTQQQAPPYPVQGQMPPGYPQYAQQPVPQQTPPRKNLSQFDPMA